jgi:hypothetical protein
MCGTHEKNKSTDILDSQTGSRCLATVGNPRKHLLENYIYLV